MSNIETFDRTTPLQPGEIRPIGQVIDSDVAKQLGSIIIDAHRQYVRNLRQYDWPYNGPFIIDPRTESPKPGISPSHVSLLRLSANELPAIHEAITVLEQTTMETVEEISTGGQVSILFGAAGDGAWHIDTAQDCRLLVNLSASAIGLKVATEWDGTDYVSRNGQTLTRFPAPAAYKTIEYGPGEGIAVNNMCPSIEQTPHAGLTEDNKVLLRISR